MSCKSSKLKIWSIIATFSLVLTTGCTQSTPMYLNDTGDLSYYLDRATEISYPDVDTVSLDEVTQARPPITVIDPDFNSFFDLTLEDCVSMTMQNSKVYRGYGTPSLQDTRVAPGQDSLANGPQAAGTIYNVAIRHSEPGFIGTPGQISAPGSITTNTGLDGNQGVEAALADFDAQFTSSFLFAKSNEPRNATPNSPFDPVIFEQDTVQWNWEYAKKSANGTQLFFRQISNWTDNNVPLQADGGFQVLDSFYRTAMEAEIRQPLLRGRGAFIQRMPIVISRLSTDQEIANLEAQLQNLVTNVEIRYWELYCAYRNFDAAKTGREAALQTLRIVENRYDEGADVNVQQVAQARGQYHFFDAQVIQTFNGLLTAESNLRWLMGIASSDNRVLRPVDEAVAAPVEFDWMTSQCEALSYRPELRQLRTEIKKRELALAYSKNSLLPELNVTGLYRWLGLGNRYGTSGDDLPFPDPSSGALNELYGGNYQELSVGGEFRMPVGFRRELANVRNSQLKLAREIARLEDTELDVTRNLHNAFQALAANRRLMQSAFNQWKETTIEEDHFLELRDAGVGTLDVALDAQRRRAQAEQTFYNALCEYNKVIALIHRQKGTTLAYNGIMFAEGQWPGKAYMDASEHARRRGASRQLNYGWTRPQVVARGSDWPSAHNNGATGTVGAPIQQQPMVDPYIETPVIHDGHMIGQPVTEPYYTPTNQGVPMMNSPMMNSPMMNSPMVSPPVMSPTPIQGSSTSTRIDSGVQQVSYNQPVADRPTKSARRIPNSRPIRKQARRNPADAAATTTLQARPKRDSATAPRQSQPILAQRLRADTQNERSSAQVRQTSASSKLNWEAFGMSNPNSATNNGQTKAKIKTIEN